MLGLAKSEPGEIERLPIPPLDELHERAENLGAGGAGGRRRNGQGMKRRRDRGGGPVCRRRRRVL